MAAPPPQQNTITGLQLVAPQPSVQAAPQAVAPVVSGPPLQGLPGPVPGGVDMNRFEALGSSAVSSNYVDPDLRTPGESGRGITVFLYGAPGTWKTTWAGQWPKPVFLSIGQEGGDDALAQLPSIYGVPIPRVYTITSAKMMVEKIQRIARDHRAMDVNTVVIDSLTYYVDLWIAEVMATRYADPKIRAKIEATGGEAAVMTMRDWGLLAMHLRDVAMQLHRTPLNIIWTALEKEMKENNEAQGTSRVVAVEPYVRGESAVKIPGMCKMIIHAHKEMKPDTRAPGRMFTQPVYYTSPNYLTKLVRHKYGTAFPEGKLTDSQNGDLPTFRAIWERIGQFVYATA